jgi:hypothetical protein
VWFICCIKSRLTRYKILLRALIKIFSSFFIQSNKRFDIRDITMTRWSTGLLGSVIEHNGPLNLSPFTKKIHEHVIFHTSRLLKRWHASCKVPLCLWSATMPVTLWIIFLLFFLLRFLLRNCAISALCTYLGSLQTVTWQ